MILCEGAVHNAESLSKCCVILNAEAFLKNVGTFWEKDAGL